MDRNFWAMRCFTLLLILTMCGCGDYAKKSSFNSYVDQTNARFNTIEPIIQTNALINMQQDKDNDLLFKTVASSTDTLRQEIWDIMVPSFILCVISSGTAFNYEISHGTSGTKIIQIK